MEQKKTHSCETPESIEKKIEEMEKVGLNESWVGKVYDLHRFMSRCESYTLKTEEGEVELLKTANGYHMLFLRDIQGKGYYSAMILELGKLDRGNFIEIVLQKLGDGGDFRDIRGVRVDLCRKYA
jgi:hypothetical protein